MQSCTAEHAIQWSAQSHQLKLACGIVRAVQKPCSACSSDLMTQGSYCRGLRLINVIRGMLCPKPAASSRRVMLSDGHLLNYGSAHAASEASGCQGKQTKQRGRLQVVQLRIATCAPSGGATEDQEQRRGPRCMRSVTGCLPALKTTP